MMFPKHTPFRNKRLTNWAHGKPCQVQSPYCTGRNTVPAHSNCSDDGKGKSQKADDSMIAIACDACHDFLDFKGKNWRAHDKDEIRWYHDRGIKRTLRMMLADGILQVSK